MIQVRKSEERGHFNHGWLNTFHTFSFSDYYDPKHMNFRHLRVINEDFVAPAEGFGTHPHRDMEIITYIMEGELEHKDSMGNGSVIRPGDIQYMSAGSGVTHSEFNPSKDNPVHLMQIWIFPNVQSAPPRYGQKAFTEEEKLNRLRLVVSPDGADGSIGIRQDAKLYAAVLEPTKTVELATEPDRHYWLQVARGSVTLNGTPLKQGDGAGAWDEGLLKIAAQEEKAEILLFDLV